MNKVPRIILSGVILTVSAVASAQPERPTEDSTPLCFLPMYGYPDREKPDDLKKADEEFIKAVTAEYTRKEASDHFAAIGWEYAGKGDYETAMTRLNQAWLLDPDSYKPYWGFGKIALHQQKNFAEAVTHFEKALSLIDEEDRGKQNLLVETAQTHSFMGVMTRTNTTDRSESDGHFSRANELFSEAQTLDPGSTKVLSFWAESLYRQGNYEKAWEKVRTARGMGHEFEPEFIESLSREMPEPKLDER